MSSPAVEVPEDVRLKAQAQGSEGRRWLGRLGRLIGELERDWGISVGSALSGGSESYVAHATMDSGAHAVVKIEMPPYPSFATEVRTLLAADVHGYVRLLEHHEGRHATLQ